MKPSTSVSVGVVLLAASAGAFVQGEIEYSQTIFDFHVHTSSSLTASKGALSRFVGGVL